MRLRKNILSLGTAATLLLSAYVSHSFGQQAFAPQYNARIEHSITLGFERQVASIYTPKSFEVSAGVKEAAKRFNTIFLRIKLTNRFRVQTGLSYKDIDRMLCNSGKCSAFNMLSNYQMTVPLTIQYQMLDHQSRLHPYFGAGVQYNLTNKNSNEANLDPALAARLQYLNIIFTQGLIYDITPDLQITQSIHIVPQNGMKPVGINLGIGYRIK